MLAFSSSVLVIGGSTAQAADAPLAADGCDATALGAGLLGQAPVGLTSTNVSKACAITSATVLQTPAGLPLPLTAAAVQAQTAVAADKRTASATGGITDLHVGLGDQLGPTIDGAVAPLFAGVDDVTVQVTTALKLLGIDPITIPVTQLVTTVETRLRTALTGALGGADVLGVKAASSTASAGCTQTTPALSGSSDVAGVNVLGLPVALDDVVGAVLPLLSSSQLATLTPSAVVTDVIDQTLASLNLGALSGTVTPLLTPLLQAALDPVLTPVLAQLKPLLDKVATYDLTKATQTRTADTLTQDALHATVTLLGRELADVSLGQARVGARTVDCTPPATPQAPVATTPAKIPAPVVPAANIALRCSNAKLLLLSANQHGDHTFVHGVADPRLIGQKVAILLTGTGKQVGTAIVGKDSFFRVNVPLPPKRIRTTNDARYVAKAVGFSSQKLKFARRMDITGSAAKGGKLRLNGVVTKPFAPGASVVVTERVSCTGKPRKVATVKPSKTGRWTAEIAIPKGYPAAIYRAGTQVRKSAKNKKAFATFSLPRTVTF